MPSAPPHLSVSSDAHSLSGRNNNSFEALAAFFESKFSLASLRPAEEGSFLTPVASISLVHLLDDPLPHRVRIPHQHPDVTVPTDRSDLRRSQAHLKEAADSLVTQVVEGEVWTAGSTAYAFPGQPEGVRGYRGKPYCSCAAASQGPLRQDE
jgi:hypothetical protein